MIYEHVMHNAHQTSIFTGRKKSVHYNGVSVLGCDANTAQRSCRWVRSAVSSALYRSRCLKYKVYRGFVGCNLSLHLQLHLGKAFYITKPFGGEEDGPRA